MKETTIQIKADKNKINAIRLCLADKNVSLETEFTEFIDTLYRKYVPQSVRDFIEKTELTNQAEVRKKAARR